MYEQMEDKVYIKKQTLEHMLGNILEFKVIADILVTL